MAKVRQPWVCQIVFCDGVETHHQHVWNAPPHNLDPYTSVIGDGVDDTQNGQDGRHATEDDHAVFVTHLSLPLQTTSPHVLKMSHTSLTSPSGLLSIRKYRFMVLKTSLMRSRLMLSDSLRWCTRSVDGQLAVWISCVRQVHGGLFAYTEVSDWMTRSFTYRSPFT